MDQASAAANAALPVGMSTAQERRKRAGPPGAAESAAAESRRAAEAEAKPEKDPAARAVPSVPDEDGFLAPEQLRAAHVASTRGSSVLEIRAPKRRRGDEVRGSVASEAEARVADDVLRLMGGGGFDAGDGDGDGDVADATGFTVPEGQSGDGRTSLNDKLGY